MGGDIRHLTIAIKAARQRERLSQRAVARKAGMPQAQISKIENAAVDPKVSTLVVLARAVGLELTLLPRTNPPAVDTPDFLDPPEKEDLPPR
jgi:transcriptional regulator with XRE-family HTH domain